MTLRVHIERLVLDGLSFSAREQAVLLDALRVELGATLAGRALATELAGGGAIPRPAGAPHTVAGGTGPAETGRGVARAVADTLAPGRANA